MHVEPHNNEFTVSFFKNIDFDQMVQHPNKSDIDQNLWRMAKEAKAKREAEDLLVVNTSGYNCRKVELFIPVNPPLNTEEDDEMYEKELKMMVEDDE